MTPLTRRELLGVGLLTAAFLLLPYPYYDRPTGRYRLDNPNEVTRAYSTRAMAEFGHLYINDVIQQWPTRTTDLSGRPRRPDEPTTHPEQLLYPAKSPGVAPLAVPAWWLFHKLAPLLGHTPDRHDLIRVCRLSLQLPLLAFALLLYAGLRRGLQSAAVARATYWTLTLGSPSYAYALLFTSHQLATGALTTLFLLLHARPQHPTRPALTHAAYALGGLLGGWAVAAEYSAVLPLLLLLAYALLRGTAPRQPDDDAGPRAWLRQRRHLPALALGVALPATLTALYHTLAFGGPLQTAYAFMLTPAFRDRMAASWHGFHPPDPATALDLFIDPANGLLLFTPLLALAPLGLAFAIHQRHRRLDAALALATTALLTLYLASLAGEWRGGWSISARYMTNVVPALGLLAAYGLDALDARRPLLARTLLAAAALPALLLTAPLAATFPHLPEDLHHPFSEVALPFLTRGLVPPNTLHLPDTLFALLLYGALATLAASTLLLPLAQTSAPNARRTAALAAALTPTLALILLLPPDPEATARFLRFFTLLGR